MDVQVDRHIFEWLYIMEEYKEHCLDESTAATVDHPTTAGRHSGLLPPDLEVRIQLRCFKQSPVAGSLSAHPTGSIPSFEQPSA